MAWSEVAEEDGVALAVVVAAFDEDAGEDARRDLGCGFAPDEIRSGKQREGVWFDVTENQDLSCGRVGTGFCTDEVGGRVYDCGVLLMLRLGGVGVRRCAWGERRSWSRGWEGEG